LTEADVGDTFRDYVRRLRQTEEERQTRKKFIKRTLGSFVVGSLITAAVGIGVGSGVGFYHTSKNYLVREKIQKLESVRQELENKRKELQRKFYWPLEILTQNNPLTIAGAKSTEHITQSISLILGKNEIKNKIIIFNDVSEFLSSLRKSNINVYAARYTPLSPETESYLYAYASQNNAFPLGLNQKEFNAKVNELEKVFDKKNRAILAGEIFSKILSENVILPVHQFEFSGCISEKWKNIQIPMLGFIVQEMNQVELR
ncbi:MAG: hypothetical protein HY843_01975, partial [Bdellovibrio sp.]|nr:hypothetical protein [Bdellovibrio sp.]